MELWYVNTKKLPHPYWYLGKYHFPRHSSSSDAIKNNKIAKKNPKKKQIKHNTLTVEKLKEISGVTISNNMVLWEILI